MSSNSAVHRPNIVNDQRRRKRLPRMLLTEDESDAVVAILQAGFADAQAQFEDMNFVKDADHPVRWLRMQAAIEDIDKRVCRAIFAFPNVGVRRPMRFSCSGHGDGPCRASAAANCLLEFPSLLARVLPQPDNNERFDMLRFRLWSFGCWEDIYIDDMLPFATDGAQVILTAPSQEDQIHEVIIPLLQYMRLEEPQTGQLELWPFFLEKAMAKMLGSYHLLKSLTFDGAISMLMGCEVISRCIADSYARQVTFLLRILTVMQRDSIVFLRQEAPSKLIGCSAECMLNNTEDIYVVLAFKEVSDVLNMHSDLKKEEKYESDNLLSLRFLKSVKMLVRKVSCGRLASRTRCHAMLAEDDEMFAEQRSSHAPKKSSVDMSLDPLFTEKGIFWESAAYLMAHFSHADLCIFTRDTPCTASEDLISLNQLHWHTARAAGAWIRGKNSITTGSLPHRASYCPFYVLDLRAATPNKPVLVILTLRQAAVSWRRANRIPVRLQLFFIGESLLKEFSKQDVLELKVRDHLERKLDAQLQLAHRSVFTTGSVDELLTLCRGSFLVLLEVGIPGDESDYILSAFCSCRCELSPLQNVVDTSFESGAWNPEMSRIVCRELTSCPVRIEKELI